MKLGRGGGAAVFARYLVFQIPGCVLAALVLAGLVRWWELPVSLAYLLFGLWVLLEIAFFPVLRIAYETGGSRGGADALVGALGVAQEDLDPEGYVRIGAERWRAVVFGKRVSVPAGASVRVREVRQLTLIVEPADVDGADSRRGG